MKILVILFLVAIFASLGSALFMLLRDQSGSTRTVKALTIRISLSIVLFLMLMSSYHFGWITQNL